MSLFKSKAKDNNSIEEKVDEVKPIKEDNIPAQGEVVDPKKKKTKKPKSKARKIIEWVGTIIIVILVALCSFVLIYSKVNSNKDPKNPVNPPIAIGNAYLPVIVLTNSMEPKYPVNSALFITKISGEDLYNKYLAWENCEDPGEKEKLAVDVTFNDYFLAQTPATVISVKDLSVKYGKRTRTTIDVQAMHTMTHRIFYADIDENAKDGEDKYYFYVNGINKNGQVSAADQYQVFTESYIYGQVTGCSPFLGGLFKFAQSPWGLVILLLIPCLYMIISSIIDLVRNNDEEEETVAVSNTDTVDPNDPLKGISEKDKERLKQELLDKLMEEKKKKKDN